MSATSPIASRQHRLLNGPVGPVLFSLSWPMSIGLFSIIAFNAVDTLYIGQLGPGPLAAMGYCFPVIFGLSAIAIGMGNGAASVVAHAIGADNMPRARELVLNTTVFVFGYSIFLALIMYFLSDEIFALLKVPPELMTYVNQYMDVWYLGLPFLILPIVLTGLVRAAGEPKVPSWLMVFAAIINAIFSPLLVFGFFGFPELGMSGAAWATILARMSIAILCILYLFRINLISLAPDCLKHFPSAVREVLRYGAPAFAAQLVSPIAGGIITRLLSNESTEAVAAFAVGARLEALAVVPFFALQSGVGPFIGQNVGAGNKDRLRLAERSVLLFAIGWGLVAAFILTVFGRDLAGFFTKDTMIMDLADHYLNLLSFGLWGAGLMIVSVGILNPLGYPNVGMAVSAFRYLAVYVGGAIVAVTFLSDSIRITGIFSASPFSWGLAGIVSLFLIHDLLLKPKGPMARSGVAPRKIVGHDDLRPNRHPEYSADDEDETTRAAS